MKRAWLTTILVACCVVLGIASRVDAATVTLAWDPNPETDIAGYVLYYGTQPGAYTTSVDVGNVASKQFTSLVSGTRYYFAVKAYNTSGVFSVLSQEISAVVAAATDTQPPSTPTITTNTATSTTQIGLTWTTSSDNVGVTGYRLERCQGAGCTGFTQVGTVVSTTYGDSGLSAATSYSYRVRATDGALNFSGYSTTASVTTLSPAPGTPTGPAPSSSASNVSLTTTVSWAVSTNATQYDVKFGTSNPPSIVSSNQTSRTYQPSTLVSGIPYFWQVVAKGAGGSTSGPVWSFTTVVPAPATPAGPLPSNSSTNVLTTIALNWAASVNATQYDVAFGSVNPPPTVATNQAGTNYQPPAFAYGTTYFWRVVAKGAGGSTSGPVWSFMTQAAPPPPPPPPASTTVRRLRLMTWNVNSGNDRTGVPNVDAQVALMANSGAHVLALQGLTITTAADLSSLYESKLEAATGRTWNSLWIPDPRPAPASPEGNLLLTTLPIVSSAVTEFDTAPSSPNSLDAKRSAGRVAVLVNNVTVNVATTQLATDATQRQAQLGQLQSWISSVPAPRLIGGNFKMVSSDTTYGQMAGAFKDSWTAIVRTNDAGMTQDLSPTQLGRVDYWWQELTNSHATPTAMWVVKTWRSTHHAVVVDVNVQ
jgi:endonuclease/exonuclease/phosphatase family metal-dependent hydrolase